MRYVDFREMVLAELHRHPAGFTWLELKQRLDLPYRQACPTWVKRLEDEDSLVRAPGATRALIWRVLS
ncbi:MAG: hypothetical protein ISR91_02655 [Candidatus Delongbacteria bacterium]|nr:hypothetical protein [bacterium]MBL7033021.1 hypothetical protein [Candidatus Delongbacteria bacterium]